MIIFSYLFRFILGKRPVIGVPVIIINSKKEILLGKRSKKSFFYPDKWGLPGGMMEYNENPEETAKREVREELGIEIKIIKKLDIYNRLPNKDCKLHSIDIPFIAEISKGNPEPKDETTKIRWFEPFEIKKIKLAYSHKEILKREKLI
jgi:8-oxo-dGTP diphosphatase